MRVSATLISGVLALMAPYTAAWAQGDRPALPVTVAPAEFPEPFTSVRGIQTIANGQLVVTDAKEGKLLLVDFAKGTTKELARKGSGPQEFQQLGRATPAKGGGVNVFDARQNRFLPISGTGQVHDVVTLPVTTNSFSFSERGPDSYTPDSLGTPFGNFYSTVRFNSASPGTILDSFPLVRTNQKGTTTDTVAKLKAAESKSVSTGQQGFVMRQAVLFSPADVWSVAADGWVGVVRANPYRAEWISPTGAVVRGPTIPYTPLAVTKVEKDSIIERFKNPPQGSNSGGIRIGGANGQTQTINAPRLDPIILDVKPAFYSDQVPVIDDAGHMWIERYQAREKKTRLYDVFDRKGTLAARYELPAGSRLVSVDKGYLYAVRQDEDDFFHLQRFARQGAGDSRGGAGR